MKRYMISAPAIIICILVLTTCSFAQPSFPKGKWWKHPEVMEKIELSEDQIQEIEKISNESMRKIIKLEAEFEIARMDLDNLLDQVEEKKLDIKALEKQIDIVNRARGELDKERILMLARIRNVLPKDKIETLIRLRGHFRKEQKEKRGRKDKDEWADEPHGQSIEK